MVAYLALYLSYLVTSFFVEIMDKHSFIFIATIVIILAVSTGVFMYAKGYNYNNQTKTLVKTGMMVVKSEPPGANIYLNGTIYKSSTNSSIANLKSGIYNLKIEKDGYALFQKDVPVKEEYATEINAVLVPLNTELRPLTTSGARNPLFTSTRDKIIFLTRDREKPGIWSLNLAGNIFSLFKGNIDVLVPDQPKSLFSLAEGLYLSPNDEQALVTMNKAGYYKLDLTASHVVPQATSSAQTIFTQWQEIDKTKKLALLKRGRIPTNLYNTASDSATVWSPDEKRFLYAIPDRENLEYHVYDTGNPLDIGEKENYTTISLPKTQISKLIWYSDSKHLIITTCEQETKEQVCVSGNIRLIRVDGTNNTLIYSGALSSTDTFPTPDGTKIIILTSFNPNSVPNLYAIILR